MAGRKGSKHQTDNLEAFAERVLRMLKAGKDTESLERQICRLIASNNDTRTAGALIAKLVEWRYGKAKQEVTGPNGGALQIQIVSAIERPR